MGQKYLVLCTMEEGRTNMLPLSSTTQNCGVLHNLLPKYSTERALTYRSILTPPAKLLTYFVQHVSYIEKCLYLLEENYVQNTRYLPYNSNDSLLP
jgi:hypothetical protein